MFKDKLKHLRVKYNVTQAELAKAVGVSAATIGNYEQGTRQPQNSDIWQKIADYFNISVDSLMDKESYDFVETVDWRQPFKTDVSIVYDGVDITSLVFSKGDISTTKEQAFAYMDFSSRRGHVIYARKQLLYILNEIKSKSVEKISEDFDKIVKFIEDNILYWYNKCWDINDFVPKAVNLETLYDLLDRCLCMDLVSAEEFYLKELNLNWDWLRGKLRSV